MTHSVTLFLFRRYPITNGNDGAIVHQNLFIITLIIISNLLVASNTSVFLIKGWKTVQPEESDAGTDSFSRLGLYYRGINIFTLLLAVIILCAFFFRYFYHAYSLSKKDDLEKIVVFVDFISIWIYILFCFADRIYIQYLKKCHNIVKDNFKEKYEIQIEVMGRAFALIDISGVVGICIIFIMSLFFSSVCNSFIQGFGIGALAFHIIFTQFNWAYLKTDELIKIQKL